MKGSYALVLRVKKSKSFRVGSLGMMKFKKGFYVYVGSGMNDLEKRVERHLRLLKQKRGKRKWHIDYLLLDSESELVTVLLFPSDKKEECKLSKYFEHVADLTVTNFGSSDCKEGCKGHLHFFKSRKKLLKVLNELE
ncbi:MAG: GIY-YIG nuclease family protein [Candidatus Aenigmarchaeota archaeon]|nr:GIY-YIG nuclease family protein [Candidatus Aenigmarchaeota archaeon]